jgi:hypothetical protein
MESHELYVFTPREILASGIMRRLLPEAGTAAKRAFLDCVKGPIAALARHNRWSDDELAAYLSSRIETEISRQTAQRLRSGHDSVLGMSAWKLDSILAAIGETSGNRLHKIQVAVCDTVLRHTWAQRYSLATGGVETCHARTEYATDVVVHAEQLINVESLTTILEAKDDRKAWSRWLDGKIRFAEQLTRSATPLELLVSVADYVFVKCCAPGSLGVERTRRVSLEEMLLCYEGNWLERHGESQDDGERRRLARWRSR